MEKNIQIRHKVYSPNKAINKDADTQTELQQSNGKS